MAVGISTTAVAFHGAGKGRWPDALMVIKGYFDDSGDDRKKKWATVGGLVGYENVWSRFELKWASATYQLKKPFHAAECEAQQGCCEGWTIQQCNALMKELTGIVKKTGGVFGSIVPIPEYRAVFPGGGVYDPYYLAVKHSIINMAYLGRLSAHNREFSAISIMHEEGDRDGKLYEIYKALKRVKTWPDAKVSGWVYHRLEAGEWTSGCRLGSS